MERESLFPLPDEHGVALVYRYSDEPAAHPWRVWQFFETVGEAREALAEARSVRPRAMWGTATFSSNFGSVTAE